MNHKSKNDVLKINISKFKNLNIIKTHLTGPLSTPIPKLHVAAITGTSPEVHLSWTLSLSFVFRPNK